MRLSSNLLILSILMSAFTPAYSVVVYEESVSGDLSNSGSTPTIITLGSGSNQIFGSTGRDGPAPGGIVDRDYFTITIPANSQLNSITLLPSTIGGNFSFFGIQAGNQVTLPTNATTADGLLGWWHYAASDINTDILNKSSVPSRGASGFTSPLGAGNYALWVQDTSQGLFNYGFDLNVSQVPLPNAFFAFLSGIVGLFGMYKRQRRLN